MSNDESYNRPKRDKSSKNDKLQELANLKKCRQSNQKYKPEFKCDDIYEYVTQDAYNELKRKRQDEDSEDDGKEIFEEDEDQQALVNLKSKKSVRNPNIKRLKSDIEKKPKNVFTTITSTHKSKKPQNNESFDDLFEAIKYEVPKISNINKAKASVNTFAKVTDKRPFKIDHPKTPIVAPLKTAIIVKPIVTVAEDFEDIESMDSWVEDSVPSTNVENKKQDIVSANVENKEKDIDDFSDFDFDESLEELITNKQGFAEAVVNNDVPDVAWDDGNFDSHETAVCDTSIFENSDDKTSKQIFWIDAYNDPNIAGAVFIFGKTFCDTERKIVNCTVKISALERRIFVLPKEDRSVKEVFTEMSAILKQHDISTFRCMNVTKNYAFQIAEVPDEAEYLMVQYDSRKPILPKDLTGETFSHIFGRDTSILELLILDLKLKGPCWLNFSQITPASKRFSICKYDFEVQGLKSISKCEKIMQNPPLKLISINIKTVVNSQTNSNEIVLVGCFLHDDVYFDQPPPNKVFQKHFTIVTQPKNSVMPYDLRTKLKSPEWKNYSDTLTIVPSESALINNLFARMHLLDPDMIVGHSLFNHQLQILLQRCQKLGVSTWHRMGRLIRNINLPKTTGRSTAWIERTVTAGRLICDVEFSGRELFKCRSYELPEMIKEILPPRLQGLRNHSESVADLSPLFTTSAGVKQLLDLTMDESLAAIHLMHKLQILPLAYQITAICGNLMCRTLSAGKAERNEYLLLHAFNEKNYITPDKNTTYQTKHDTNNDLEEEAVTTGKRKPTYLGGLVLEPKKGFYENFILLMDFNSLYPSIIQELNICFTTIDRQIYLGGKNAVAKDGDADVVDINLNKLMEEATLNSDKPIGILPYKINKLIEERKKIKNLLKQSKANLTKEKEMQYDIMQTALKITANSMYGCLGFVHSRFQATQLASLITYKGREILQETKELVESGKITFKINNVLTPLKLEIVYGDTDSVMINTGLNKLTDFDTVMAIGRKIKDAVNKKYNKIELDIDGVFRRLLLLKKKKYAALTISKNLETKELVTKQELKGLDIVRRDWCKLTVDVGRNVVTKILEGEMSHDDLQLSVISYLEAVRDSVNGGQEPLDQFVITKKLNRNPEAYASAQSQPHVLVALRLNQAGAAKKLRANDTVEYVICNDGSTKNDIQRAYSPAEVIKNKEGLQIDTQYYLSKQLLSVVTRLVDWNAGLSGATVAASLGLDPQAYLPRAGGVSGLTGDDLRDAEEAAMAGLDPFKCCRPLVVRCPGCGHDNELASPLGPVTAWPCANCRENLLGASRQGHVLNTITRGIGAYKRECSLNMHTCQDLECGNVTRDVDSHQSWDAYGNRLCSRCGTGVLRPALSQTELNNQIRFFKSLFANKAVDFFARVRQLVDGVLKRSAFNTVSFEDLFVKLGIADY